jgi:4-hydroxy-tetrahydrodipicolinate reductase
VIAIALLGALGRMGRAIEEAAAEAGDVRVRLRLDRAEALAQIPGSSSFPAVYAENRAGAGEGEVLPVSDLAPSLQLGDVVVDFSGPDGTRAAALACAERGVPLVSGTTGLSPEHEEAVRQAARRVAVLRAANFSLGVLALRRVLATALDTAPKDWDLEIVERHHHHKADSPSGTALQLAREAARARGLSESDFCFGRQGEVGPRPAREIGIHAIRGGSWIGDHTVLLAGQGEWLELRHVAQDRGAFARGALTAARFVGGAKPGLYTLDHLLNPPS